MTIPNGIASIGGYAFYDLDSLTTGISSTFSPEATCTRGQIVTFLYRALAED